MVTEVTPKFSIIINCYNSEEYLNKCIDSVLNQSYSNLEIVIINNCSTDNTKKIVSSYSDKRIKYFETPKFMSLGKARNFGLDKVKGEFIGFLDSDDYWEIDKLKNSRLLFNKNNGVVYSDVTYFSKKESFKLYDKRRAYKGKCFEKLLNDYSLCLSSVLFSKEIIERYSIEFDDSYEVCEDYDFFLKLASKTKIDFVNKPDVNYRIHNNNLTIKKRLLFFKEKEIIINSLPLLYIKSKEKALYQNQIEKAVYFWKKRQTFKSFEILKNQNKFLLKRIFYFFLFLVPYELIKRILKHKSIFDQ